MAEAEAQGADTVMTQGGPAPGEWRGEIRTSRGRWHDDRLHVGPRLGRGSVAQARVQTPPVVKDPDVLEHRRPGLRAAAEPDVVDVLLLERGEGGLRRRVVEAVAAPAHRRGSCRAGSSTAGCRAAPAPRGTAPRRTGRRDPSGGSARAPAAAAAGP